MGDFPFSLSFLSFLSHSIQSHGKPSFIQPLTDDLSIFASFGTTFGVQCKHDAPLAMTVLQLLGNAFREVIEATLLINIGAKLVYHLVYPH